MGFQKNIGKPDLTPDRIRFAGFLSSCEHRMARGGDGQGGVGVKMCCDQIGHPAIRLAGPLDRDRLIEIDPSDNPMID